MKFKRTIQKKFVSPKVKSIEVHPNRPICIVGLFTGCIQIWDVDKMALLNSIHVSNEPIRTCAILVKMDWVLVGSDDGHVSVYELSKYRKIKSFDAHGDFIRKIESHPQKPVFITASDDTTLKMWTYENDIAQSMVYNGHDYIVMDVCFYPNDSNKFISCSLDSTIKVWSVEQSHCIKTFKGHTSGINSICFLRDTQYLVSGADDLTLKVWDFQSTQCIATLNGHTNNVNKVYPLKSFPLFASCSEDGTIRLWNSKTFKQEDFVALQGGRVWDVKEKDNKMLVGCDEELVFINMHQASSLVGMSNGKIFYSVSDSVFGVKSDNLGAVKELSSLGFYPIELKVSPGGKKIALGNENEFKVFSSLAFRNKVSGDGRDFHFITDDEFVVRDNDTINFYKKSEMVKAVTIPRISKLFYLNSEMIGCNGVEGTRLYSISGEFIFHIDLTSDHLFTVGGFLVACGSKICIYRINKEIINAFVEQGIEIPAEGIDDGLELLSTEHYTVSSYVIGDNVFYFTAGSKAYYTILCDSPYVYHFSTISGILAGVLDGLVFYLHDKAIGCKKVDMEFLEFQRSTLLKKECGVSDSIRNKAVVFFQSLGMHEKALELCLEDNQKFEILLKLGKYEEAFERANSIIKYDKIGRCFLSEDELSKASECFLKSRNWMNLLLSDVLSEKRYLKTVGMECVKEGRMNCGFIAYLKCGEYDECAKLLENTPFHSLFVKNYLTQ